MTGKKITFLFIFIICCTFIYSYSVRADNKFYLEVETTHPEKEVGFEVKIKARDEKAEKILEEINPYRYIRFNHLGTYSLKNTGTGKYRVILYTLGKREISAHIKYNGKRYTTNKVKIDVVPQDYENNDIFFTTELSNQSVYFGQVFIYDLNLYSAGEEIEYDCDRYGEFEGFYSDVFKDDERYEVFLYGKEFVKYKISQILLSPTKIGNIYLPPCRITVPAEDNNLEKDKVFQTDHYKVKVLSLPEANKPQDFRGLVGSLEMESKLNKEKFNIDDEIILNIKLSGSCNLKLLDNIITEDLPAFIVYEDIVDYKEEVIDGKYYNEKEFEVMLIPKRKGIQKIPEIRIDYFDPNNKKYKEEIIPATKINVVPKKSMSINNGDNLVNNANQVKNEKQNNNEIVIRHVVTDDENMSGNYSLIIKKSYTHISLTVLVILFIGFLILYYLSNRKVEKDKLEIIYSKIKNTEDSDKLYNLLNEMIKLRYNISLKANTRIKIENTINNQEVVNSVFRVMEAIEEGNELIDIKDEIEKIYRNFINPSS